MSEFVALTVPCLQCGVLCEVYVRADDEDAPTEVLAPWALHRECVPAWLQRRGEPPPDLEVK